MSRWQFHQCNGGRLDDDLFENAVYQDAIGFVKDQLTSNQDRIASLDGWRAVSIGMVLAAHSTMTAGFPDVLRPLFKWIADADLGVRCFFLISGLLITWLLLREKQTRGTINLRDFYLRRVIRILPVYYAFLLVIVVLTLTTPFNQAASSWVANLTFTTNFVQNGPWTTGHLWSLAVEEQFYLLWPGILVLSLAFNRKRQTKILIVILIGALALAPLSRAASYELRRLASENPLASPYSFFNYFDSIALGCGCAPSFGSEYGCVSKSAVGRSLPCCEGNGMLPVAGF